MLPWAWVKRGARPPVHSQEVGPPTSLGKPMLTYLVPELPAQHSARRRLATPLLLSQGANQLPVKTHADISARMTPISTNSLLPIPTCSQPQTLTIDPHVAPTSCSHLCLLGTRSAYALTLLLLWRQRSWGRQILQQGQGPLRAWWVPAGTRPPCRAREASIANGPLLSNFRLKDKLKVTQERFRTQP